MSMTCHPAKATRKSVSAIRCHGGALMAKARILFCAALDPADDL
jgi:hypothetical protein